MEKIGTGIGIDWKFLCKVKVARRESNNNPVIGILSYKIDEPPK